MHEPMLSPRRDDALSTAMQQHDHATVAALLREGADGRDVHRACVVFRGGLLETPLRQACRLGDERMVTVLLDAGADPHRSAAQGTVPESNRPGTPHWSWDLGGFLPTPSPAIAALLAQHGWPRTQDDRDRALLDAALRQQPELVTQRLNEGAQVHARLALPVMVMPGAAASLGNTALHLALLAPKDPDAAQQRLDAVRGTVERLLAAGADPNARNDEGLTPLQVGVRAHFPTGYDALAAEHSRALQRLVEHGADVNVAGKEGSPLLRALVESRHAGLVPVLRAAGARLTYPPALDEAFAAIFGTLPVGPGAALLGAVYGGTPEQVQAALDLGDDPNAAAQPLDFSCSRLGFTTSLVALVHRLEQDSTDDVPAVLDRLERAGLDVIAGIRTPEWRAMVDDLGPSGPGASRDAQRRHDRVVQVLQRAETLDLQRALTDGATALVAPRSRL